MNAPYGIRWREGSVTWFIRGVRSDGVFYGDATDDSPAQRRKWNVEGTLSDEESRRFHAIADSIASQSETCAGAQQSATGLLARGTPATPVVLFVRPERRDNDADLTCDALFEELLAILRPHVER